MNRTKNISGKMLTALRANPRVADIETEGCDEERFFVHLTGEWSYTQDPCAVTHSQSFTRARDAIRAVNNAVPAANWPVHS